MKELTQMLVEFKRVTIEIISALQRDEINKLDFLLDSRQVIIENMEKLQYSTEEFTMVCNELDILNIQQKLSELMKLKKEDTKEQLDKIQITKNANNNYNKSFYVNSGTFNKQI
ncbi:hypothetical protein [Clostridium sp. CF012]|uniref:hypothetical protein n=1 Tax=Clostridium sp. CF012 TaxID=2843319 RepID=UPI001C0B56D9|nr:hypothetical protein [Clostridium sp. CF012]MBU3142342.1 hypothetical protein [Clostridium sp. CF012]